MQSLIQSSSSLLVVVVLVLLLFRHQYHQGDEIHSSRTGGDERGVKEVLRDRAVLAARRRQGRTGCQQDI